MRRLVFATLLLAASPASAEPLKPLDDILVATKGKATGSDFQYLAIRCSALGIYHATQHQKDSEDWVRAIKFAAKFMKDAGQVNGTLKKESDINYVVGLAAQRYGETPISVRNKDVTTCNYFMENVK